MPKKTYEEQLEAYNEQMKKIQAKKSELKRKRQQKVYKKAYDVLTKSERFKDYEITDDLLFNSTVDEIVKHMNNAEEKIAEEFRKDAKKRREEYEAAIKQQQGT